MFEKTILAFALAASAALLATAQEPASGAAEPVTGPGAVAVPEPAVPPVPPVGYQSQMLALVEAKKYDEAKNVGRKYMREHPGDTEAALYLAGYLVSAASSGVLGEAAESLYYLDLCAADGTETEREEARKLKDTALDIILKIGVAPPEAPLTDEQRKALLEDEEAAAKLLAQRESELADAEKRLEAAKKEYGRLTERAESLRNEISRIRDTPAGKHREPTDFKNLELSEEAPKVQPPAAGTPSSGARSSAPSGGAPRPLSPGSVWTRSVKEGETLESFTKRVHPTKDSAAMMNRIRELNPGKIGPKGELVPGEDLLVPER